MITWCARTERAGRLDEDDVKAGDEIDDMIVDDIDGE